jgi:spermidine synthase
MLTWRTLDTAAVPGGGQLTLHARGEERVIRLDGRELMSSRLHASEDALGTLGCAGLGPGARVLIGGLGLGFTLRAVLDAVGRGAEVVVAELSPAVVRWNQEELGHFAGHPLRDPRVRIYEGDVADCFSEPAAFDAILLDVDNGPGALATANRALYGGAALRRAKHALRRGGIYALWSPGESPPFERRLAKQGFRVETKRIRARGGAGGARHVVFLART